jgi:hypothetical protein
MSADYRCRECLRLAVQLRNAIAMRNGSKETDARVLIKRHMQATHPQAPGNGGLGGGGGDASRTPARLLPDAKTQPYAAADGKRLFVPLRGTPDQSTANLELSRDDAEQLCARLGYLLDGGRSLESYARRYGY